MSTLLPEREWVPSAQLQRDAVMLERLARAGLPILTDPDELRGRFARALAQERIAIETVGAFFVERVMDRARSCSSRRALEVMARHQQAAIA